MVKNNKEIEKPKNVERKVVVVLLTTATLASVILPVMSVFASEAESSESQEIYVVDEKWGKPTFVLGGGLTDAEVEETLRIFGVDREAVHLDTATGEELVRYLGEGTGDTSSMISSVLVKKQDADKGITVEIVNPENITLITPMQYKKAVINLGVEGVDLKISSIRPATGESALTGVYKALEVNGEELSEGQMDLSNAETELFADVNEQNAETENYNPDEVTLLITELQKEVADLKKGKEPLSDEQLNELVNEAVKEKGLDSYITADNVNVIVDTLNIFQNTPELIDNKQILESTEELSDTLGDSISDGFNYLKEQVPSTDAISEESKNFFQKLWDSVTDFFGNLFGGDEEEPVEEEPVVEESQVNDSQPDESKGDDSLIDESNTEEVAPEQEESNAATDESEKATEEAVDPTIEEERETKDIKEEPVTDEKGQGVSRSEGSNAVENPDESVSSTDEQENSLDLQNESDVESTK